MPWLFALSVFYAGAQTYILFFKMLTYLSLFMYEFWVAERNVKNGNSPFSTEGVGICERLKVMCRHSNQKRHCLSNFPVCSSFLFLFIRAQISFQACTHCWRLWQMSFPYHKDFRRSSLVCEAGFPVYRSHIDSSPAHNIYWCML